MEKVKISDWIVNFLVKKNITDVFGYPGGMAVHFMDSLSKNTLINSHVTYNEQGAAFAACSYAQIKNNVGVCFSSSGPGFTNLITGITNAYFDSVPILILTFNVNTYESARYMPIKQKGFQEMDVLSIAKKITKKAYYIEDCDEIPKIFEQAYEIALTGRRGPVLIDIPMNISREFIENSKYSKALEFHNLNINYHEIFLQKFNELIKQSKQPCFIFGNGLMNINRKLLNSVIDKYKIPVVTSMVAVDLIQTNNPFSYGFLGAYGHRETNFIVAKSDLIISIGSRLDVRQISTNSSNFAPQANLLRIDIDDDELTNKVKNNEIQINIDAIKAIELLLENNIDIPVFNEWINKCNEIKYRLDGHDDQLGNKYIKELSRHLEADSIITTDVGQNQVWVAQSFEIQSNQRLLFSGNFGSMGYSLPASIGAYYASLKPIYSFNGDGGIQMNIQELQFIGREKLPIKIFILNNNSLGMIRHFQEMYMEENYTLTTKEGGYTNPDFELIAKAYNLDYSKIENLEQIMTLDLKNQKPEIIEIILPDKTYVFPKLAMQKPNQDQEPLLNRELYDYLMSL